MVLRFRVCTVDGQRSAAFCSGCLSEDVTALRLPRDEAFGGNREFAVIRAMFTLADDLE